MEENAIETTTEIDEFGDTIVHHSRSDVIHKEGHIGFVCDFCKEKEVWFPLCPNAETDKWEAMVWRIYTDKLNEPMRLCWECESKVKKAVGESKFNRFERVTGLTETDRQEILLHKTQVKKNDYE